MKNISLLKWGMLAAVAIAVLAIFFSFFNKKKGGVDYKELIKAKDETIKVLQDQRPFYEDIILLLNEFIEHHQRQDSILVTKISTNQQTIRTIDEKLKSIPARMAAIADSSNAAIRRAISDL
jgi:hypothetical protein